MSRILVINPGSTSTKAAVFEDGRVLFDETVRHPKAELARFETIPAQKNYRFQMIKTAMEDRGIAFEDLDGVAARGGIIQPLESGTYEINEEMVRDLQGSKASLHASCLAGLIGYDLKLRYGIPAFVTDPVVVDELCHEARLTGVPGVERISIFHALNQKAMGRLCAEEMGRTYEDCRFIIAHLGGGISVAAHDLGRVVDVNNAISGEGPFSPERAGTLSMLQVADLICHQGYTYEDIKDLATKNGGVMALLGINDMRRVGQMVQEGHEKARQVMEAMAYQVAKEIGAMAAVLGGKADAIILTGGIAYWKDFTDLIQCRVGFIAPVKGFPGEHEIEALASSVQRVLTGREIPKVYKG